MASDVDLESLRLIVAIDETGSLGAAARSLSISQPAASARLRTLEAHWNLGLVSRSPRGSRLTEDGQAVCTWARNVLAEIEVLRSGMIALSAHREVSLTVAASLTIAEYLLPRWLGQLRNAQPAVHPGLKVVNSTDVVALVRTNDCDVGFIETPIRPQALKTRRVGHDRLALVVHHQHPWARRRTPLTVAELARTELVLREPGSGTRNTFERALGQPPLVAMEAGSTSAMISAAVANLAPAVVSEVAAHAQLSAGSLVRVPVALDLRRPLTAVWRIGERLSSPAAELVRIAARND